MTFLKNICRKKREYIREIFAKTQTTTLIKLALSDFLSAVPISLFADQSLTSCTLLLVHTTAALLVLIDTHINHAKYLGDKPIINLHHQVEPSDNEFSWNAADQSFINCGRLG